MLGDKPIDAAGFIPVMLTPFDEKGRIDYNMLTRLTEFYCEYGAIGLFANCLSSEMFDLSPEERLGITRHIVELVDGRMPVVATGNFGDSIDDQAIFVKEMHNIGVDAVILATSILASQEDPEVTLVDNTLRLMDLTENIPLGFYECPVPYKRVLSAEVLKRFLASGRIVYYKDTSLDVEQISAKIKAANGYSFRLYDAHLVNAVASLKAGANGLSCIQGNFFPEIIVWLCQNFDHEVLQSEVARVQQFLTDSMEVMHTGYPTVAKYFLQKRGLPISLFCRSAQSQLDSTAASKIDQLFDDYIVLKADLGV